MTLAPAVALIAVDLIRTWVIMPELVPMVNAVLWLDFRCAMLRALKWAVKTTASFFA